MEDLGLATALLRDPKALELVGAGSGRCATAVGRRQDRPSRSRLVTATPVYVDEPMGRFIVSLRQAQGRESCGLTEQLPGRTVIDADPRPGLRRRASRASNEVVILAAGRDVAEGLLEAPGCSCRVPGWRASWFHNVPAPGRFYGAIQTPWAPPERSADGLADDQRNGGPAIRAGAVLSASGPISGEFVATRRFRGDHASWDIVVQRRAPELQVEARDPTLPELGAAVRLALLPGPCTSSMSRRHLWSMTDTDIQRAAGANWPSLQIDVELIVLRYRHPSVRSAAAGSCCSHPKCVSMVI